MLHVALAAAAGKYLEACRMVYVASGIYMVYVASGIYVVCVASGIYMVHVVASPPVARRAASRRRQCATATRSAAAGPTPFKESRDARVCGACDMTSGHARYDRAVAVAVPCLPVAASTAPGALTGLCTRLRDSRLRPSPHSSFLANVNEAQYPHAGVFSISSRYAANDWSPS